VNVNYLLESNHHVTITWKLVGFVDVIIIPIFSSLLIIEMKRSTVVTYFNFAL